MIPLDDWAIAEHLGRPINQSEAGFLLEVFAQLLPKSEMAREVNSQAIENA